MMELCQLVLEGKEMLGTWQTSLLVPNCKEKGDVRNMDTVE